MALFYVAVRVWQSLARAEPIDVYPLLRPFAIGICIMLFPTLVLGTMNTVLSPIVQGTHKMLEGQTMDMQQYREQKDRLEREAMLRNPETAYLVSDEEFDRQLDELGWSPDAMATRMGMYMEVGMYNLEKNIRDAFRSLLELLFAAASLLIDTVRTFFLVVLSILGPIAFAFSVWDGFQSTLSQWFTRYISVYLWLPVSDLFSCMLAKIQVLMLQNDILELQNNPNYSLDNSNSVYVIFMLIGIIGYLPCRPWPDGLCRQAVPETTTETSTVPRPRPEDLQPVPQVPDWEISEGVCVENKLNRNIKIMKTDGIQITDQY